MLLCILIGVLFLCNFSEQNATNTSLEDQPDTYFPNLEWSDTFDWKLLKAFSSNPRNVLLSPISVKLVLALLYEGSAGITERQFQHVLQFPVQKEDMRENYQKILKALESTGEKEEYLLALGTRVFLDSAVTAKQHFAAKAATYYRTSIQPTNFSDAEEASQIINKWVSDLTGGKVSHLVSEGDVRDAVLIIANAINFKGTWRHQFPKNQTALGGFYVAPDIIVEVPYMTTTDAFYYFESNELDAKILRLPYRGGKFSLFIVLPRSKGGLQALIRKISLTLLKKQLYLMDKVPVQVRIPKLNFKFRVKLTKTLQEFGLRQMFQNTASFPGIARGSPNLLRMLSVSDILQNCGIEVDEEGSVAYAATEVQVGNKFGEVDYFFNATHPFLFFLEEQSTGSILFVGKIENPLESTSIELPSRAGENENNQQSISDIEPQSLTDVPDLEPPNPEKDAIISRFNYFDLELLAVCSESPGNLFISPASIKTTLALILEGAKGKNAQEISDALRIGNIDQKEIREVLSRLLFDLNDRTPNTLLEAANSLFVSNKYNVIPDYEQKVAKYYKTTVKPLDFTKSNEAANIINSWANNATHGFIQQIIGGQSLYPDTTLVIANALYFKGKWKTAFDPRSTKEKSFISPTRGPVKIPMMQVTDTFNYNFNVKLNAHAVELPYQDDKYAMLILLPTNGSHVRALARDMVHVQLNEVIDTLKPNELVLEIPKFEIDYSADLVQFLKPLKIQEIFGVNAHLPGIVTQDNIKVSNMIHKTRVEVNEQGTKAAAATAAVVVPLMGTTTQKVIADHPFIFFIYHKESRNIIFEGLFAEPPQTPSPNALKTGHFQYYSHPRVGPSYGRLDYPRNNNNAYRYQ